MTRRYTKRNVEQKTDYTADQVEDYKAKLSIPHYTILVKAAGTSDYKTIAAALGVVSLGTVKSRLNRARIELAVLIKADEDSECQAKHEEPEPILPGGPDLEEARYAPED